MLRTKFPRRRRIFIAILVVYGCGDVDAQDNQRCIEDGTTTIAFVGDLLFQGELQRNAMGQGSSYRRFWSAAEPLFRSVDAVYGNLEGTLTANVTYFGAPTADPGKDVGSDVYSSPPGILNFNYHRSLASDLRLSGFRIISTGNNHALDRGIEGVDQTIKHLERQGIAAVGTRHSEDLDAPWGKVTFIRSMGVGWVACTYGTNGNPDRLGQVLDCFEQREDVLAAISSLAARADVAAVFFVPHWGIENHSVIERRQEQLGRDAIAAGATAVIGTHPHMLQEWHWATSPRGTRAPIIYSTGNFISAQTENYQRNGIVVLITIQTRKREQKAGLVSVRFILTEFEPLKGSLRFGQYDPALHSQLPNTERLDHTQLDRYLRCGLRINPASH